MKLLKNLTIHAKSDWYEKVNGPWSTKDVKGETGSIDFGLPFGLIFRNERGNQDKTTRLTANQYKSKNKEIIIHEHAYRAPAYTLFFFSFFLRGPHRYLSLHLTLLLIINLS